MRKEEILKIRMTVGGEAIGSSLNSPVGQKISSSFGKISRNGFSLAEAMIVVLIGAIALGMSAPMISRQLKNETLTNTQMQILQRQIDRLKENQSGVEDGAVMFYATDSCPENWAKITGFGGYYLRIQNAGETIGSIKEQMVHRHKHVSPIVHYDSANVGNVFRYGPFKSSYANIFGDGTYDTKPTTFPPLSTGNYSDSTTGSIAYTSDGMNRKETLMRKNKYFYDVTVCPNRDVGDEICNPTDNNFDIPYLSDMPLVGNENRPNSLVLTACVKGYKTCSMVDNKLSCSK